jgi:class 3 adenylate cyclase
MNCPACQTFNPSGARFCLNCGAALAITCVHCESELPPDAHFCMNCGQAVGASSQNDVERLSRLTAATPPPLAAKLRANAYLAGEQRIVTALFLDVVGSTNIQQKLGEQAWSEVITEAFNRFYPLIYRYEGTIARVHKDTLLAFFGAPIAHEDDPLRAVYAAQDLLLGASSLAQELDAYRKVPFSVRIGLSTGPLVISGIGQDLQFEYRPVGNLINLASRIQTLVPAGNIAIAEETHRLIGQHIETTAHCMLNLEGQAEPTCVHKLERLNAGSGELRGLSGFDSRMVGRGAEISDLMELGETVQAGLGRAVLILGEPGIGKTRLVDEWRVLLSRDRDRPELGWYRARG